MARNVIIDCDTGLDDAVALLLALRSPQLNVLGITCVAGNVSLANVLNNTLKVVEHSGKNVTVYAGAAQPFVPKLSADASHVHGADGLGGLVFPAPHISAEQEHAVDFIIRTTMQVQEPLEWITLAPLTNIALALQKEPCLVEKVKHITMMAGGMDCGNATPMAEFNVYADPEAAKIVFDSVIPKTMVPLDPLYNGGYLIAEDIEVLSAASEKPWCDMAAKILGRDRNTASMLTRSPLPGGGVIAPPDLLTMAAILNPEVLEWEEYRVFIETEGEFGRGMTAVDRRRYITPPNYADRTKMRIGVRADQKKYAAVLLDTWLA